MPTILHIITRLIHGGAQKNTVMTCAAQVAAGHQVVLVHGPIYGPEGSLLSDAKSSGAQLIEVKWLRRAVLPMHDALCYRALRQVIRQVRPDVVHTHSSKAGIVGRAAAWAERVPAVVHTIHGLPFHEAQSRFVHRGYVTAERWAARRCHRLIGITQAMCDAFIANGIGNAKQFAVVPSGVEIEQFERTGDCRQTVRAQLGIHESAPVVGIVARLDPLKGQNDLLDILPRLRQRLPNVRLLIVGDGWQREALAQRVLQAKLESCVHFTGLVEPARVAQLMAAMDVCALPSQQEGQGRTLVEALAAGCAIVGYDVGGIPEVCIDQVTGRLAPIGDRDALLAAIVELLEHDELRQRLIQRGRAHVRQHFDARVMLEKLERVYSEVLER